jgi:hypothetical protein
MFRFAVIAVVLICFAAPAHALMAAPACTKEAKSCPDGSSVGRTGPNCEFALCPGEAALAETGSGTIVPDGIVTSGDSPGVVEGNDGSEGGMDGSADNTGEIKPDPISHPAPLPEGGMRMCTMEAKICPDGTGVGRTGANCEFAPCPEEERVLSR